MAEIQGGGTNYDGTALVNLSTGSTVLIVRGIFSDNGTNDNQYLAIQPGFTGTSLSPGNSAPYANVAAVLNTAPAPAGAMYSFSLATEPLRSYQVGSDSAILVTLPYDWPFQTLLPGWALLCFQDPKGTDFHRFSVWWQECAIDELDCFD